MTDARRTLEAGIYNKHGLSPASSTMLIINPCSQRPSRVDGSAHHAHGGVSLRARRWGHSGLKVTTLARLGPVERLSPTITDYQFSTL